MLFYFALFSEDKVYSTYASPASVDYCITVYYFCKSEMTSSVSLNNRTGDWLHIHSQNKNTLLKLHLALMPRMKFKREQGLQQKVTKQMGSKLLAITLAPLQDLIPNLVAKIIAIDHYKVGIKYSRGARVMANNLLTTCFIIFYCDL